MQHLIDSVRASIRERNWYGALSVALALPDICARIEEPLQTASQKRYVAWFDKYVSQFYRRMVGRSLHTFLTGDDCYALRCAYLHEGDFDISSQRARKVLDSYVFVATPPGTFVHLNQTNATLQLQVDLFCEEILSGVETRLSGAALSPDIQARIAALPQVRIWSLGAPL